MRVLIIEDEPQNRYMARFLLEQAGHTVVAECDNGDDGISQALALQPELILMDMTLPGTDGFEATRQLRADPAMADTTIVAFTALAMKGDRERTLDAGCNGYLSKPINPTTFVQELEALL
ncbi:MAG: response regulator [Mariprofundales bacterium]